MLKDEFARIVAMSPGEVTVSGGDTDPARAKQIAGPTVIAMLTPEYQALTQFSAESPAAEKLGRIELLYTTARLAYWEQKDALDTIEHLTNSKVADQIVRGQIANNFKLWLQAGDDAEAQHLAVADLQSLSHQYQTNDDLSRCMIYAVEHFAMPTDTAHQLNLLIKKMKTASEADYFSAPEHSGEPLVIKGSALKGGDFSTAKWKGKVVLVDFWASWCPWCVSAVPRNIELYKKYHDQGLEILGVSSDFAKKDLTAFLAQHPDMVWPELFNSSSHGNWHPLTGTLNVEGLPDIMLIDRNGILRSNIMGRAAPPELIEKLLAEPADKIPSPATRNIGR